MSAGRLAQPEMLEPGDEVRTTASVEYVVPRPRGNWWATSPDLGSQYKTTPRYRSNAVTAETVVPFKDKNFVAGRYEWPQRDELFADNPSLVHQLAVQTGSRFFNVAYTIGYTRDFGRFHDVETGLGANVSLYGIPAAIKTYYGDHPAGFNVYLRIRLKENR